MLPYLGNVRTYLFLYFLSMIVHLWVAIVCCRRMSVRPRVAVWLAVAYAFGMAVGARILYDVLHQKLELSNYLTLKYYFTDGLWGGPLAYLMIVVPLVLLFGERKRDLLDLTVIPLAVSMVVAKIACFANGCCFGLPSDVPWAMAFPEGAEAPAGIARHPTQLYEIATLVVILIAFHFLDRRKWRGMLVVWFVGFYGIGRPLSEFFRAAVDREPFLGPLTASQVVCFAAALTCIPWIARYAYGLSRRGQSDLAGASLE